MAAAESAAWHLRSLRDISDGLPLKVHRKPPTPLRRHELVGIARVVGRKVLWGQRPQPRRVRTDGGLTDEGNTRVHSRVGAPPRAELTALASDEACVAASTRAGHDPVCSQSLRGERDPAQRRVTTSGRSDAAAVQQIGAEQFAEVEHPNPALVDITLHHKVHDLHAEPMRSCQPHQPVPALSGVPTLPAALPEGVA